LLLLHIHPPVLRKEWDALAASYPDRLTVVYSLDKPSKGWTGPVGYITPELVKKHAAIAAEKAGDKVKVFVCGVSCSPDSSLRLGLLIFARRLSRLTLFLLIHLLL
jgi:hypothetical protein